MKKNAVATTDTGQPEKPCETVSVQVNEQALLKNLKFAFSNSFTVVTELLQNGRRAGATKIDIQHFDNEGEDVLIVTDDGIGITEFQKLLTIAESGWDANTVATESPFGMGFLSALFAARRVVVESGGRTLDMDTEHMLTLSDVRILPVSEYTGKGMRVSLFGVTRIKGDKIPDLVRGFPIPVTLNGKELERDRAIDGKYAFVETEHGLLYLNHEQSLRDVWHKGNSIELYLQGFLMNGRDLRNPDAVLHLDPTKFFGRMPDRDVLVDAQETKTLISQFVTQQVYDWCVMKISEMGGEAFAEKFGEHAFKGFPELLSELDFLPRQILSKPEVISQNSDRWTDEGFHRHLSRADIESGKVQVFSNTESLYDESDTTVVWQWIRQCASAVALTDYLELPEGHWVIPYLEDAITDEAMVVEAVNPSKRGKVHGAWMHSQDLVLCDAVKMAYKGQEILIEDYSIYDLVTGIMVPNKATHADGIAEIALDYTIDDRFDEGACNEDENAINNTISLLRSQDFAKEISGEIALLAFQDGIAGKQFLVSYCQTPQRKHDAHNLDVVELGDVLSKLNISQDALDAALKSVLDDRKAKQEAQAA